MATHSIANVALLASATGSRPASDSTGNVAEGRQVIAVATAEVAPREMEATHEKLQDMVSHLKEFVQNMQRDMDFAVDDRTGRFVVTVTDSQTNELIRQIPSEELLSIARHLADYVDEANTPKGFFIEVNA
ncbi:MAG: flagellar protein FlaG [Gammaproteobacteria bacterium]|nr:flagellar protein FlaG [Gammaproteobacteria bacterium]